MVVPSIVRDLAGLNKKHLLRPLLSLYKLSEKVKLQQFFKSIILPTKYQDEIKEIDMQPDYLAA